VFSKRQETRLQYRRRIREGQKLETVSYTNDLHDALITKKVEYSGNVGIQNSTRIVTDVGKLTVWWTMTLSLLTL